MQAEKELPCTQQSAVVADATTWCPRLVQQVGFML